MASLIYKRFIVACSCREKEEDEAGAEPVTLDDFELLAVLGRGGFGKVMQVRHRPTGVVYAMKILKKSELRRRRQVERTQTERTILANVRHPFIVCLHYAFQNAQKLYMVMDFVQVCIAYLSYSNSACLFVSAILFHR